MSKRLVVETHASSCYFRTSVEGDERKALVQITERCNLHCAHCFVSSTQVGMDIPLEEMIETVLPRLRRARVTRLTLTGGEPFVHPHLVEICAATARMDLSVKICTNATQTSDAQIAALAALGNVRVNVSFDGFRPSSHGRFRGDRNSFAITLETTRRFADAGLLHGILSTPNVLTRPEEFAELCAFAADLGAEYVLMNPLSSFGRGVKSHGRLAAPEQTMRAIAAATAPLAGRVELVPIRFPNDNRPLSGCDAGTLIYVFANGDTAVCPYLVFAARTPQSRHADREFLVGNILHGEIADALDRYRFHDRYQVGANPTCGACALSDSCGKGCPAAVVAAGQPIGGPDADQCPPETVRRPLIPIQPVRA
ncbi:radical SAM additional 4Fe4S-binding SPASM domain-containing protein [Micromonospora pallida]|uniref:Radical SAM additional 4Fe4S-binding SPASM domain-containing protein n=1 Tax=Micromonospora pallida TaxID=145854 RepID=A0A1C6RTL6_9ACTN|nr:radical SAM protein [Micromonospora pallida]SCL20562.1 radical SAM additional 4Fe4S-binding SPASM domain-containing protein [Micromonospora pallida]